MSIEEILRNGIEILEKNNIEDSFFKSRMILSKILNKPKEYFITHNLEIVAKKDENVFFELIEKLVKGIPVQYITNNQSFMGYDFFVNENVLIPQPDTEILVMEALNHIVGDQKILDLCTGSGAIGISIYKVLEKRRMYNTNKIVLSDISEKALEVAKINSKKLDAKVEIIQSNLFENISEKFDLILSNPPYIETKIIGNLSLEVKNEPIIALDGGEDGLYFYRKIAKESIKYLEDNGILILEIGYNQKDSVINILKENGYTDVNCIKDFGNNDRVIVAKR